MSIRHHEIKYTPHYPPVHVDQTPRDEKYNPLSTLFKMIRLHELRNTSQYPPVNQNVWDGGEYLPTLFRSIRLLITENISVQINQTGEMRIMENIYLPFSGPSDSVDHGEYLHSLFRSSRLSWSWRIPTFPVQVHQTVWDEGHEKYSPALFRSIRLSWSRRIPSFLVQVNQTVWDEGHEKYPPALFRSIRLCWSWRIPSFLVQVSQTEHLPCSNLSDCVRWRSWKIPTCPVQVNQTVLIMENTFIPCSGQSDCVGWRSRIISTCPVQVNQTLLIMVVMQGFATVLFQLNLNQSAWSHLRGSWLACAYGHMDVVDLAVNSQRLSLLGDLVASLCKSETHAILPHDLALIRG